jgi:hypothetical protein
MNQNDTVPARPHSTILKEFKLDDTIKVSLFSLSLKILMTEKEWMRVGGQSANREHMLMALANLDHILIRAVHSPATTQAS